MKYGCAFSPRPSPGRCVKDPGSSKVDSQCQAIDGVCRLVGASLPQKPIEEKKMEPQIQPPQIQPLKFKNNLQSKLNMTERLAVQFQRMRQNRERVIISLVMLTLV